MCCRTEHGPPTSASPTALRQTCDLLGQPDHPPALQLTCKLTPVHRAHTLRRPLPLGSHSPITSPPNHPPDSSSEQCGQTEGGIRPQMTSAVAWIGYKRLRSFTHSFIHWLTTHPPISHNSSRPWRQSSENNSVESPAFPGRTCSTGVGGWGTGL